MEQLLDFWPEILSQVKDSLSYFGKILAEALLTFFLKTWPLVKAAFPPLVGTFVGAILAFISNIYLERWRRKENDTREERKENQRQLAELQYAKLSLIANREKLLLFKKTFNSTLTKPMHDPENGYQFGLFPPLIFFPITAPETLRFMCSYEHDILHPFYKVREHINELQFHILERNKTVNNLIAVPNIQKKETLKILIGLLNSYAEILFHNMDNSLRFVQKSIETLDKYAKDHFNENKLSPMVMLEKEWESLLPSENNSEAQ